MSLRAAAAAGGIEAGISRNRREEAERASVSLSCVAGFRQRETRVLVPGVWGERSTVWVRYCTSHTPDHYCFGVFTFTTVQRVSSLSPYGTVII